MALTSASSTADRLAAAGDILVGATLLLAIVASAVAVLAYAVSTGTPDLQISVQFGCFPAEEGRFAVTFEDDQGGKHAVDNGQLKCSIRLRNNSSYSARNPAVVVRLKSMAFRSPESSQDWAQIDFDRQSGIKAMQWDGGPVYSVHGHSTRRLPDLNLIGLRTAYDYSNPWDHALRFEILADGYRREVSIPVDFIEFDRRRSPAVEMGFLPDWL